MSLYRGNLRLNREAKPVFVDVRDRTLADAEGALAYYGY
jgi:hypothetical protein